MRLALLTTTDMKSDRAMDFARMIASVAENVPPGVELKHYVLLQRATEAQRSEVARAIPHPATVLSTDGRLSLSAARNQMLARARADGQLEADTIVGFPDDDCWYLPGFLASLVALFETRRDLGLLISRVSLSPVDDWPADGGERAGGRDVLRRSSSNGMFLRGDVVARIGDFDVTLGLGTPSNSGEDTDYALRGWLASPLTLFVDRPLVGHKEPDLASITKYFGGNMLVASRYAPRSPALFLEYVRKFGVGSYLVLRQRLAMADFLSAIQGSMAAFGRSTG
ncbi:MAG: glycosyltransferase family 2 protein [Hyphomicrobiaceae bacterium]